jgi:hypothetical protein
MWSAHSDERTDLSFTTAAGPCQRSHSRVRVSWDSCSYFAVSDSRHLFSSPPMTRKDMVEVFDPASTRGSCKNLTSLYITFQPTEFMKPLPTVNLIASLRCCASNDSLLYISGVNSYSNRCVAMDAYS